MVEWQSTRRRRTFRPDWFRIAVYAIAFVGCAAFWLALKDLMI